MTAASLRRLTLTNFRSYHAASLDIGTNLVVLTGPNAHEVRDDVPTPRPGPMEVLCRVDSTAICGTDLHIYEGKFPGRWPKVTALWNSPFATLAQSSGIWPSRAPIPSALIQ